MEKNWEIFENECYKYLKENYNTKATFLPCGKSDSTKPDIQVCNKKGEERFYIEVKSKSAQAGQFVVVSDEEQKCFTLSAKNKLKDNKHTQEIVDCMNKNFNKYNSASTAGVGFSEMEELLYKWVVEFYLNKNVKYFMTENNIILPTEKLHNYFNISATYRIKKSGSRDISKSKADIIGDYFLNNNHISSYEYTNKKLYVNSATLNIGQKFIIDNEEYYVSEKLGGIVIKALSKTRNRNVIFSLQLKNAIKQDVLDLKAFENDIDED